MWNFFSIFIYLYFLLPPAVVGRAAVIRNRKGTGDGFGKFVLVSGGGVAIVKILSRRRFANKK